MAVGIPYLSAILSVCEAWLSENASFRLSETSQLSEPSDYHCTASRGQTMNCAELSEYKVNCQNITRYMNCQSITRWTHSCQNINADCHKTWLNIAVKKGKHSGTIPLLSAVLPLSSGTVAIFKKSSISIFLWHYNTSQKYYSSQSNLCIATSPKCLSTKKFTPFEFYRTKTLVNKEY